MAKAELETPDQQYFPLSGGLDQVSPALSLKPGMCRDSINFECNILGGYTRIAGFERFDGRPKPSEQTYWTLTCNVTPMTLAVGDTLLGVTSAATAVVSRLDNTAIPGAMTVVVTKLTGSFTPTGENLTVGGVVKAHTQGAEQRNAAQNPKLDAQYNKAAADIYRADIQKVPGSGAVLGVWLYNDITYAFRNIADGTAAKMYKATVAGWVAVTTPTLAPGGRYEFCNGNFGGTAAMKKMFGVDGANKGFMFDGVTFTQITTGMAIDKPNHVCFHKNYLWYAFAASLQRSSIGDPTVWSVVVGAGEIALGDRITALKPYIGQAGSFTAAVAALLITTDTTTQVLYGSSDTDFQLTPKSTEAGGVQGSVQMLDQPYYLSDLGVVNLATTQAFGNFQMSSLSQQINPFILQEKSRVTTSCIARGKSQYRLYFNDGFALHVSFINGKIVGLMPMNLGIAMQCVCSQKTTAQNELFFAGDANGYVYEMEKGPNFDGASILSYLYLAFSAFKSPRFTKRWRRAVIEVKGTGYLEYSASYDLGWATTEIPTTPGTLVTSALSSAQWDHFTWDQFFWDGVQEGPSLVDLDGRGENIGMKLVSEGDYFASFNVASMIIHYSMGRQLRG